MRKLLHLARADFWERTRRYSFLMTLGAAVYLGWATIAGYGGMDVGGYRGVYNSAWIGTMVAMTTTVLVALVGFYIVKNAVDRDRQTRVGEILATTPISRAQYLLGKLISNFAVLAAIVAVLAVAALVMQLIQGEERHIHLWALLSPFLLVTIPVIAFTGALALFFETVPGLRGGFGNIAYFFLWGFLLAAPAITKAGWADLVCILPVEASVKAAAKANFEEYKGGFSIGFGPRRNYQTMRTFEWNGVDWTAERLAQRLGILAAALGLALLPALWFDRFDPARGRPLEELARRAKRKGPERAATDSGEAAPREAPRPAEAHLTPLGDRELEPRFVRVFLAELRLLLKGHRWWWYAGAAGLLIASATTPLQNAREVVLPLVWLWPVLLWSSLGTRETRHATDQLLFCAPHPLRWQLPAAWAAGVVLAALTGSVIGLRLLLAGDAAAFAAWTVGALFIPTLALTLGVWSGTSKFFEGFYTVLWYVGPLQHTPTLDFLGTTPAAIEARAPLTFLLLTAVLGGLAFAGRRRQLQLRDSTGGLLARLRRS